MQAVTGNKKNKIIFYIFVFVFLTTIGFHEKADTFDKEGIFTLKEIELFGHEKINHDFLRMELNSLLGKNLLSLKSSEIADILKNNKLIKEFKLKKNYPNKINIYLKEVEFVATLTKDKTKYFLTDNNSLIPFDSHLTDLNLPIIYGKKAENYFNDFRKLLTSNNFDLNIITSYYFFQINRWDLIIDEKKNY